MNTVVRGFMWLSELGFLRAAPAFFPSGLFLFWLLSLCGQPFVAAPDVSQVPLLQSGRDFGACVPYLTYHLSRSTLVLVYNLRYL